MRVGRLVALAGLAMLIAASVSYAHVHAPQGIGGDKYRNTTSQHSTNVEPDSFAWGNTIVSAYQVGRFNNGGGSNVGFATSTDGGRTWKKGGLPNMTEHSTPPGEWARVERSRGGLRPRARRLDDRDARHQRPSGRRSRAYQPLDRRRPHLAAAGHGVGGTRHVLRQELARLRHVVAEPALRQLLRGVGRQRPRQPDADEHLDGRRGDVGRRSIRRTRRPGSAASRSSSRTAPSSCRTRRTTARSGRSARWTAA